MPTPLLVKYGALARCDPRTARGARVATRPSSPGGATREEALLLSLQRTAGNAAVSACISDALDDRSSTGSRLGRAAATPVQRCGLTPCDCPLEERVAGGERPGSSGGHGARLDATTLMELQRIAGNRAVTDLVAGQPRADGQRGPGGDRVEDEPTTSAVQRYATCTPARLSGLDCPPRAPGERARARDGPMVFIPTLKLDTGETGVLIANFDIGRATVKSNLHATIYWRQFLERVSADGSRWALVGFSDCEGSERRNAGLRAQRAGAVFDLLPKALQARIDSSEGAASGECITENDGPGDRTLNRSVALLLTEETVDEPAEVITDSLERKEPGTRDCSADQRKRLAVAVPLAKRLAENAVRLIDAMKKGSPEEALFRKFFGPDAFAERRHIKIGYQDALRAWNDDPTYQCVKQGTDPCSGGIAGYTGARALVTGSPIVICESAFGDDLELADTVLHEETHALAWTDDNEECGTSGCHLPTTSESLPGIGLSDSGALTNAASYSRFASQAYAQGFR